MKNRKWQRQSDNFDVNNQLFVIKDRDCNFGTEEII